ncbi:3-keto-5-aminohexanoate cleavage protein [Rhodobacteraceae bacterium RKSG542]|uniref:3-keto-5-aminohexanoate cleavage protein n=1 Tax=Pseudovibrio flavus TaxID=2529854 RepID=UPI0012BCC1EB|nr:3-keto-5-aminohexanoate cleavage protein [Pseudovibrio flavus]MTI16123.1 3-keto-5-aminohexanoate cleavage protein [Pseudovibrio flavus]
MLPKMIMCAPNGARRTKADHPSLPVTIDELVITARSTFAAGANALHAHVRDKDGKHVLDAGLYKELLEQLHQDAPDLVVQITTEAVGEYDPLAQIGVVEQVMPEAVSVALSELTSDPSLEEEASRFYHFAKEAGIAVQHILYSADDLKKLVALQESGFIPNGYGSHLYVLGRYSTTQESDAADLLSFLNHRETLSELHQAPFTLCAFGRRETLCLAAGMSLGAHARVGFENSIWHADGKIARDNAERVGAISKLRELIGYHGRLDRHETLKILGRP